jgi:predicted nucleic acid-binding protein
MDGQLGAAAISRTEVIAGMREHDQAMTLHFRDALACYPLEVAVVDRAGHLIRRYRSQSVTLDMPDAAIAATALHYDLVLLTYNARHYPMPELQRYTAMPSLAWCTVHAKNRIALMGWEMRVVEARRGGKG